MYPYDLRTDARIEPLSVATATPALSWRLRSGHRGETPAGFRIEAASSLERLLSGEADLWRSAVIPAGRPLAEWQGRPLASRDQVHWRVAVPAAADDDLVWSEPAAFEVPLVAPTDWSGRWVTHPEWRDGPRHPRPGALPVLWTTSRASHGIKRARAYVSGTGVFTMTVNGRRASEDHLSPGYSRLDRRIAAVAWDVTRLFAEGENEVVVELGTGIGVVEQLEGRYTKLERDVLAPRVLAQIELEYQDGSRQVVGTDRHWRAALGPTLIAHWYGGEDADARRTVDPASATSAVELGGPELHDVWWSECPPIRMTERLEPVSVTAHEDGKVRVFDFGVNIAGVPALRLDDAVAGRTITIVPAEILDAAGRATQWSTGGPTWDSYVTRGGEQEWSPRFTYHGFRHLEVSGLDDDPDDAVNALVLRAANQPVGEFSTSDEFLSTLHRMIDRSVQGNMFSVFTDCPHREKLGWLEQLHLCFDTLARNYDVQAQLRDALVHMRDAQLPSGAIPSIAPEIVDFSGISFEGAPDAFREDPNWGGALVLVSWRLYEHYGDRRALTESWPAILRYLDYLDARAADGVLDFGLGDWVALDRSTPRAMVATHGYIRILEAAVRIATTLGDERGSRLAANAAQVRDAFCRRFGADGLTWGSASQASYALALDLGVVSPEHTRPVVERLLQAIDTAGYQFTVGENALPSMLRVLHAHGRDDVINRCVRATGGSGYGYQVARGLTALAERWTVEDGDGVDASLNHFMLGMIDEWITGTLVGLEQADGSVGWERIRIAPTVLHGIEHMATRLESPMGEIRVAWEYGELFRLTVVLPPGVTGIVELPLGTAPGADPRQGIPIGSGVWEFESRFDECGGSVA